VGQLTGAQSVSHLINRNYREGPQIPYGWVNSSSGVTLAVIQGDAVPQRFIPKLIRLYREGQFPFDRLVKFYEFGDINRAIREANQGVTIKPVLLM
jgi:Zn-dependent alcohol dehydrogenase